MRALLSMIAAALETFRSLMHRLAGSLDPRDQTDPAKTCVAIGVIRERSNLSI